MDILSAQELRSLMNPRLGICVSIYMPTLRSGIHVQQNQIRFRNALRKAEEDLTQNDLSPSEIKALLAPAQELLGDLPFWRNLNDGLALFLAPDEFKYYRLAQPFAELVAVADRYHIKPLIPVIRRDQEFFILAVSQKSVRFYRCLRYRSQAVHLPRVPASLDEALNLDDFEKRLQRHEGSEDTKMQLLRFFQQVDRGLHEYLLDKRALLVFAGVDYLLPIFREANTYSHLAERNVSGNPDSLSVDELRERAWQIVEPSLAQDKIQALNQFVAQRGKGLDSADVKEIVGAACHGRVGMLFLLPGLHRWGRFAVETGEVVLRDEPEPGAEDLLDLAATETLRNGGTVYALEAGELPGVDCMAALMRY